MVYSSLDQELLVLIFNFTCFFRHSDSLQGHLLWFARARVSFRSCEYRHVFFLFGFLPIVYGILLRHAQYQGFWCVVMSLWTYHREKMSKACLFQSTNSLIQKLKEIDLLSCFLHTLTPARSMHPLLLKLNYVNWVWFKFNGRFAIWEVRARLFGQVNSCDFNTWHLLAL